MKEYAKHKVKVWLEAECVPDPNELPQEGLHFVLLVPTGEVYPEWEIEHTEECDKLKYGQECALDWMLGQDSEGMPTEPGNYLVWVVDESHFVNSYSHYGWEAEYYIDYERIDDE